VQGRALCVLFTPTGGLAGEELSFFVYSIGTVPRLSARLIVTDNSGMPSRPANPKGIVPSSPGSRACELPWEFVQTTSQPQRGCGRARHPRPQARRGWLVPTRWTQGRSFLTTLGFAAESLRDSRNSSSKMWVVISRQERRGLGGPDQRRLTSAATLSLGRSCGYLIN